MAFIRTYVQFNKTECMDILDYNKLEKYFNHFELWFKKKYPNENFTSFNHPFFQNEEYKTRIQKEAFSHFKGKPTFKKEDIGKGKIFERLMFIINKIDDNLVKQGHFGITKFKNKFESNLELNERTFFDFFKNVDFSKNETFFVNIKELADDLRIIAFFFFIRDESKKKYLPVTPEKFDNIFKALNIDFQLCKNWKKNGWQIIVNITILLIILKSSYLRN